MAATLLPFPPTPAPDPEAQEILADIMQHGRAITRLAARLAEVEEAALAVVQEEAVAAYRDALAQNTTVERRNDAANRADASEAARDVINARATAITANYERAARAVRRTAALRARLAAGRLPRAGWPPREAAGGVADPAIPARPRVPGEQDPNSDWCNSDWEDEIAGHTAVAVMRAVRRDLVSALPAAARAAPAAPPAPVAPAPGRAASPPGRPRPPAPDG